MQKPTKYYFYRHLIALSFLIILGLRFGKIKGMLIVIIIYLALNADALQWAYYYIKGGKSGEL
jgi:hypothetical protein